MKTQLPAYGNKEKERKCSHRNANAPPIDKETCVKCDLWSEMDFGELPDVCPVDIDGSSQFLLFLTGEGH
jgi:hypothetical protein